MFSIFMRVLVFHTVLAFGLQPSQTRVAFFEDRPKPSPGNLQLASTEDVGQQVQAVISAMSKETPKGLHLKSAILSLQTGSAKEKSIELTLVIFTISHKSKMGATQTTVITFGDKQLAEFEANFAPPTFDQQFKKQIDQAVAIADVVKVLGVAQISAKVEFIVNKDTSGGLTFSASGPFGVGKLGGDLKYDKTKTSTNSLELIYK